MPTAYSLYRTHPNAGWRPNTGWKQNTGWKPIEHGSYDMASIQDRMHPLDIYQYNTGPLYYTSRRSPVYLIGSTQCCDVTMYYNVNQGNDRCSLLKSLGKTDSHIPARRVFILSGHLSYSLGSYLHCYNKSRECMT